ncbi:hypothetical protein CR513_33441, partial [Mucuna pruriens]
DLTLVKLELEWNQDDFNLLQLNTKSRYIITCALSKSKSKYNKFYIYKTIKEMWDALRITYKGIGDVQLRKVVTLYRHYEMFMMKDDETINEIFWIVSQKFGNLRALLFDKFKI